MPARTVNANGTLATVTGDPPSSHAGSHIEGGSDHIARMLEVVEADAYVTRAAPAFATSYKPSAIRPTFVALDFEIVLDPSGEAGRIIVLVGPADPPAFTIGTFWSNFRNDAIGALPVDAKRMPFSFILPPNHFYRVNTQIDTGAPSFFFNKASELTL